MVDAVDGAVDSVDAVVAVFVDVEVVVPLPPLLQTTFAAQSQVLIWSLKRVPSEHV